MVVLSVFFDSMEKSLQTVSESKVGTDQEVEIQVRTMDIKLQQILSHLQRNEERRTNSYSSQFTPAECSTQCALSPQKNKLSPRPKRVNAPPWNSQVLPSYSEPYHSLREQEDETLQIAIAERDSVVNKLELPIFYGTYPYGWISQVERFFRIGRYSEEERMNLLFLCLSGEALKWYHWEAVREPFTNWLQLKSRLLLRFGKPKVKSPAPGLIALKQTGSGLITKEEKESSKVPNEKVEDHERLVSRECEASKELIVKEIDCGTSPNGSVNQWENRMAAEKPLRKKGIAVRDGLLTHSQGDVKTKQSSSLPESELVALTLKMENKLISGRMSKDVSIDGSEEKAYNNTMWKSTTALVPYTTTRVNSGEGSNEAVTGIKSFLMTAAPDNHVNTIMLRDSFVSWTQRKSCLLLRFSSAKNHSPIPSLVAVIKRYGGCRRVALSEWVSLKPDGDYVDVYLDKCECALTHLSLTADQALSIFLTNLNPFLAIHTRQFYVPYIDETSYIAKLHELYLQSSAPNPNRAPFSPYKHNPPQINRNPNSHHLNNYHSNTPPLLPPPNNPKPISIPRNQHYTGGLGGIAR